MAFDSEKKLQLFVELIGIIIWPLTVLLILLIFRKTFTDVILRLGTLKADKSGIELSFSKRIEAAKKMFRQIKPSVALKSGESIKILQGKDDSAFGRILQVRSNLTNYLKTIADREGVVTESLSPILISDRLKEIGAIPIQRSQMVNTLLEITAAANDSASEEQAKEIETLFQKIEIH